MGFFKSIERSLRRGLVKLLARRPRRPRPIPADLDFNSCRFLFIRQDRIGDILISTPVFATLKDHYPGARLDIIVSDNNRVALKGIPYLTRGWIYSKRFGAVWSLVRGIRKEHYDFAVDLMDNSSATSTALMLCAGARWNVGLEKENSYAYDVVIPLRSRKEVHIIERIAELLRAFRISPEKEDLRVRYAPQAASFTRADAVLGRLQLVEKLVLGVNISAGSQARYWGAAQYRALLSEWSRRWEDLHMVLLAKPSDRQLAVEIARNIARVQVAPDLSFDELAAFVSRCSALLTPDTAAVHLAAAASVPALVLYVQSDPDLRIWDPYRSAYEAVITKESSLSGISVPEVSEAFDRLRSRVQLRPVSVEELNR